MKFDFKVTVWERIKVNDEEDQKKILELIKSGQITSADDIWNMGLGETAESEILSDTSEQMIVEENGGASTIEVMNGTEIVFQNGE